MKNIFFIFVFFSNISFSLDLNNFDERQEVLKSVKTIILYEESIAKAYEEYILTKYSIPTLTQVKNLIGNLNTQVSGITNTLTLNNDVAKISYSLSSELLADSNIKALYESNTFRKKTYVRDNEVYFILEDVFAKHLYDLIKTSKEKISTLSTCPNTVFSVPTDCIENNHIYVQLTKKLDGINLVPDSYLMAYHIDKFKTGPIIITNNTSKHITESAFDSVPKGALLYDTNGIKYTKTLSGIEPLK